MRWKLVGLHVGCLRPPYKVFITGTSIGRSMENTAQDGTIDPTPDYVIVHSVKASSVRTRLSLQDVLHTCTAVLSYISVELAAQASFVPLRSTRQTDSPHSSRCHASLAPSLHVSTAGRQPQLRLHVIRHSGVGIPVDFPRAHVGRLDRRPAVLHAKRNIRLVRHPVLSRPHSLWHVLRAQSPHRHYLDQVRTALAAAGSRTTTRECVEQNLGRLHRVAAWESPGNVETAGVAANRTRAGEGGAGWLDAQGIGQGSGTRRLGGVFVANHRADYCEHADYGDGVS